MMTGNDAEEYCTAMAKKMHQLEEKKTWWIMHHETIPRDAYVLPSTLIFKHKRLLDGTIHKYRACFGVHGDRQVEGINFI